MTAAHSQPAVSIVGIGCRVPGASGPEELWRLLVEGRDGTGAPPPDREGAGRGGYLPAVAEFDNDWFAISDREAALMDPQQRLALEVAVEAIDDAGIGYRVRGSNAAVLFGACGFDHGAVVLGSGGRDAPYAVTGSALSIIANRLSYALDLHGPSVVLDSACSSSLAAVDLAMRLLADDAVPFAVVGGVNLALLPHTSQYLAQGGFLAPDGRCKPFDAAADGYARGDGATVLVLQRTEDARREGNRRYAEILGAAVGSDGRSNGLYAPSGRAQQQVVRNAWARAGLDIRDAGYFECHGTGTPVGDAVEVEALAAVLGPADDAAPRLIGSVKSNIGHLEAAAGVTGLAKTALSLWHGIIVPTINFHRENPMLRLSERGLRVPTESVVWDRRADVPRCAGVSSFGFGGTNAHVVLREAEPDSTARELAAPVLIALTGRDEIELRETADRCAAALADETLSLPDLAAAGRALPQAVRAAILVDDAEDAADALRTIAHGDPAPNTVLGIGTRRRGRVLFLFSGQGGQHARMGRELAARYPVFAQALAEITDAIVAAGGPRVWTPRHGFSAGVDSTETVQPALFAYQIALTRLLAAWGLEPDGVSGHSLGEIAAATVAGAISVPDAARLVTERSRLLGRLTGQGSMALLEATPDQARRLVEPLRAEVAVAAVNGPRAVVVSGTNRYMETLLRRAERRRYYARPVPVDFAAHSPQVRSLVEEFTEAVAPLTPQPPRVPLFSTARPATIIESATMDIGYWIDNLCGTVELDTAVETALARGYTTVVEISPHAVLAPTVREHPELADAVVAAADRDGEATALLRAIGAMYIRGRDIDWSAQGPAAPAGRRRWRRKTFPLLTRTATDPASDRLDDHVVAGIPTVPAAYWIRRLLDSVPGPIRLADFTVHERTDIADLSAVGYRVGADLRVVLGPLTVASARTTTAATPADILTWMRAIDTHRAAENSSAAIDLAEFYSGLSRRGLDYGPVFRPLTGIRAGSRSAVGTFDSPPVSTAALDGCLQLIAAAAHELLPADGLALPVGIGSVWISDAHRLRLTEAHAFVRDRVGDDLLCDVIALDQYDAPAMALLDIRIHCSAVAEPDVTAVPVPGRSIDTVPLRRLGAPARSAGYDPTVATAPEWADSVLREEYWAPLPEPPVTERNPSISRVFVVGESELATAVTREIDRLVPTQRVAREPGDAGAILASAAIGSADTGVVLVWPESVPATITAATDAVGKALRILQQTVTSPATATMTVVLRDPSSIEQNAVAALVRTLQLESGRPVRLIWSDGGDPGMLRDLVLARTAPDELRVERAAAQVRRFRPLGGEGFAVPVSTEGTYVVTGGLGALGAAAVRWLLDQGAHDVVVLTRTPRPLPPLLDGAEDRVVVVRCDVTDRADLSNALNDIRACGSTVRGVIHAAGVLRDSEFDAVTPESVNHHFEPKAGAAVSLLDLTSCDPTDFTLLFSSATGLLGAPGQAAYAAANAALDATARASQDRSVISIAWGSWDSGLARSAGGAQHLRAAGVTPFDVARGLAVLSAVVGRPRSVVLALDYTATGDTTSVGDRLRTLLSDKHISLDGAQSDRTPVVTPSEPSLSSVGDGDIHGIVRATVAGTLSRPIESVDPNADFGSLDLSSLLAIDLRRRLEHRLGIRIATAELFENPSVAALSKALAVRVPQRETS
ncbi:polyketide synthase [Nocardia nova SH22a]|uniref:Polyketide synthase n=2 Tax=Nocardia nova TaxID=37330 RepID=W5TSL5_9NOCA|nr:type I polyketide synthase [Nocardia nova]AGB51439.1 putative polyketide synthase [Nocardia nova]AHH22307.1 polyketide synthase [Nocardia nova SH22a]